MLEETEKTIGFFCDIFIIDCISIGGTRAAWPHSDYAFAIDSLKHKFKLLVAVSFQQHQTRLKRMLGSGLFSQTAAL